jgi:hypothetical protein
VGFAIGGIETFCSDIALLRNRGWGGSSVIGVDYYYYYYYYYHRCRRRLLCEG